MTFLTRRVDEAVLIGDDIRVRVATIAPDHVVLSVAYPDEAGTPVERTCSLELDDRVEIPPSGAAVHVMAIRGDRVRLGIDVRDERSVTRQELRADAPKPAGAARSKPRAKPAAKGSAGKLQRHRTHTLEAPIDRAVRVGQQMTLRLTDCDADGCRVLIDGELVGGPEDGLRIREARELRVGGAPLELGTQVQVAVQAVRTPVGATLLITAPNHVEVGLG